MDSLIQEESPGPASVDPLTVFIASHRSALPRTRGKRYEGGEHAWLADHGAEQARVSLANEFGIDHIGAEVFSSIARKAGDEELRYGELVALSGDFYESADALFDEKPSPFPWLWEGNDLSDLRAIFAEELRWIEGRRTGQGGTTYPDASIRLAWNAKSYVELALKNTDHFGWHNVCKYVECHGEALRLAARAAGRRNEDFRRALYTNAFADHFLTDGFAAGHVRVPRAEIRDWAEELGYSEKIAGALSKLLHDQDGHVDTHSLHGSGDENHRAANDGLRVSNGQGETWLTYCDGQLFLAPDATDGLAVKKPVEAVAASVRELLLAWTRQELPNGVYAATCIVPFPDAGTPTLVDKFPADLPDADVERLWESIAWYAKVPWLSGLEREHVVALFKALPTIMERFRAHVATASVAPEIVRRVDPAYFAAYRRVS